MARTGAPLDERSAASYTKNGQNLRIDDRIVLASTYTTNYGPAREFILHTSRDDRVTAKRSDVLLRRHMVPLRALYRHAARLPSTRTRPQEDTPLLWYRCTTCTTRRMNGDGNGDYVFRSLNSSQLVALSIFRDWRLPAVAHSNTATQVVHGPPSE